MNSGGCTFWTAQIPAIRIQNGGILHWSFRIDCNEQHKGIVKQ